VQHGACQPGQSLGLIPLAACHGQQRPPAQVASPLVLRPYDLRHGGVSLRLNAGVPATQVAEWAGHSVEVLLTIYAKCIHGRDQVWFAYIDKALGPDDHE
jgi:hypothetical protein